MDKKSAKKVNPSVEKTVWVIMQRSYEYNDETYDMQEGGNVVVAFDDYNKAVDALEEKMIKSVRNGECYMYYGWEPSAYFSDSDAFSEMLEGYGFSFSELGNYSSFNEFVEKMENATDDEIKLFIEHLNEPLYYIESVKLA